MIDNLRQYIYLVVGAYVVFYGIMILAKGKVSDREETRISGYSEKGRKIYRTGNGILSIFSGLILVGFALASLFDLMDESTRMIIGLIALGVLLLAFFVVWILSKKSK